MEITPRCTTLGYASEICTCLNLPMVPLGFRHMDMHAITRRGTKAQRWGTCEHSMCYSEAKSGPTGLGRTVFLLYLVFKPLSFGVEVIELIMKVSQCLGESMATDETNM
jgi:hypothetical protein